MMSFTVSLNYFAVFLKYAFCRVVIPKVKFYYHHIITKRYI